MTDQITGKKKLQLISISVIALLFVLTLLFWASHLHCFEYNDWWILGKTEQQIAQRYGEPKELWWERGVGYPFTSVRYYYIVFDSNGRACEVGLTREP